jgi:plasmid replication initiation protein
LNNKTLVVKDNRLIEASYTLGLTEQRLILMAIAWARQNDIELTRDTWVELRACDYSALYGVDLEVSYKQLSAACESLQHRQLKVAGVDRMTRAPAVYVSKWVTSAIYVKDVGLVRMQFDAMLVPYVSDLDSHFTSYTLGSICGLSSYYAMRLYELLAQYKNVGKRTIMIGELKDYLECDLPSYERLDNFKSRVVDSALKQINDSTDIACEYELNKLGKRVVGFDFKIKLKQTKARPKKPKQLPSPALPAPLKIELTTAERAMLKDLQVSRPDLTIDAIKAMSATQGIDPLMVMINLKKSS